MRSLAESGSSIGSSELFLAVFTFQTRDTSTPSRLHKDQRKADQKEMDTALSRYKEMMAEVREVTQAEAKAAKDKKPTKK